MKMPKKSTTTNRAKSAPETSLVIGNRCNFETSDGRRCRMPRHKDHPALCSFHARDEQQLLESQRLGSEISASLTGQFMTATDINFVLGKLFTALAQGRIPRRNAATLAYIGHLMLHSLSDIKKEYSFKYDYEGWENMLDEAVHLSNPTPTIASTNLPNLPKTLKQYSCAKYSPPTFHRGAIPASNPRSVLHPSSLRRHISLLECGVLQNAPITPLKCAVPKSLDLKRDYIPHTKSVITSWHAPRT